MRGQFCWGSLTSNTSKSFLDGLSDLNPQYIANIIMNIMKAIKAS